MRYAVGAAAASADPGATPVIGGDRYETAVRVRRAVLQRADRGGGGERHQHPDALAGAVHIIVNGGALLLTDPNTLSGITSAYLRNHAPGINRAFVYGGPGAVRRHADPAAAAGDLVVRRWRPHRMADRRLGDVLLQEPGCATDLCQRPERCGDTAGGGHSRSSSVGSASTYRGAGDVTPARRAPWSVISSAARTATTRWPAQATMVADRRRLVEYVQTRECLRTGATSSGGHRGRRGILTTYAQMVNDRGHRGLRRAKEWSRRLAVVIGCGSDGAAQLG